MHFFIFYIFLYIRIHMLFIFIYSQTPLIKGTFYFSDFCIHKLEKAFFKNFFYSFSENTYPCVFHVSS
jgi:hypothetical protein